MHKKATKRLQIVKRVSGTVWGMEARILAISTHALIESVVNYGLATTGSHVGQQILDKIDTGILNNAARKVIGTNIAARREVLYSMADVRTSHNHYVVKTANMLDRALRASNTAAKTNAWGFLDTQYTQTSKEKGKMQECKWKVSQQNAAERATKSEKTYKSIPGKEICDISSFAWEATKDRWAEKEQLPTQTSIYHANIDTAGTLKNTPQLLFKRINGANAYELAASILRYVGWHPSVVFDQPAYPRKFRRINWARMHWETEEEPRQPSTDESKMLQLTVEPLKHLEYAIATTRIESPDGKKATWAHVMGTKILPNPSCLEGINLKLGLEKLQQQLKQEKVKDTDKEHEKGQKWQLAIYTGYLSNMGPTQLLRWKQYGVPYDPIPGHSELNEVLADISHNPRICEVKIRKVPKEYAHGLRLTNTAEQRNLKQGIESLQTANSRLPVFWCTQREIKELLKDKQDANEGKVIQQLGRDANLASLSCRIYTEWGLHREKIRRILTALSYDRMLQVTFGTLICATRFKILEGGKMAEVRCPRCGAKDTWDHLQSCYEITIPQHKIEKEWMKAMDDIVNKLCTPNPAHNEILVKTTAGKGKRKLSTK